MSTVSAAAKPRTFSLQNAIGSCSNYISNLRELDISNMTPQEVRNYALNEFRENTIPRFINAKSLKSTPLVSSESIVSAKTTRRVIKITGRPKPKRDPKETESAFNKRTEEWESGIIRDSLDRNGVLPERNDPNYVFNCDTLQYNKNKGLKRDVKYVACHETLTKMNSKGKVIDDPDYVAQVAPASASDEDNVIED